ncbi:MAG: DNA primase [Planctomycetota bacterium]
MSGRASVVIIEQVRQANDIVDVVSSYVTLTRAGKSFKAPCPFHREKTPSFHVTPDKQVFHCFGCGVGGDVFKFVQLRENADFREALAILANRAGIVLEESSHDSGERAEHHKPTLARANDWASRWFQRQLRGPEGRHAFEYAVRRGFSEDSMDRFGIGLAPHGSDALLRAGRRAGLADDLMVAAGLVKRGNEGGLYDGFRNRLMFPIRDAINRTIGFGGRALGDDKAKYINSPQSVLFDKSRCLYGVETAKQAFGAERRAVVVEGYVDCIMAQQYGFPTTVATLGTALTVEQVRSLQRYVDEVVLVFDSDEAGQRAADSALELFLTEKLDVKLARVPEAKDPAELLVSAGAEAFSAVLTSARDALEFKWDQVSRRYRGAATGPDRRRAIEAFLGLLASTANLGACDPIQRGLLLNQVGKLLALSSEEVNRQLRIVSRRLPGSSRQDIGRVCDRAVGTHSAAETAMRSLLGVLLNQPEYFEAVAHVFDPDLMSDGDLKEIAAAVVEMIRADKALTLSTLISRFESVRASGLITGLQVDGERTGNFAATVEGAVRRLDELREQCRLNESMTSLREADRRAAATPEGSEPVKETVGADADEQLALRVVNEVSGGIGAFAAYRHSARQAAVGPEPAAAPPAD